MTILQRYLFREFMGFWYGITSILLLILVSENLVMILAEAIAGKVDSSVIFPLFITNLFQFSVSLVPLGLFLGIMMGMGRLYHESEMAAAYACGLSPTDILKPALYVGLIGALLVSLLGFFIAPWAAGIEQRIIEKQQARQEIEKIEAGRFNLSENGKTAVFVQQKSNNKINRVFIKTQGDKQTEVAELALWGQINRPFEEGDKYFSFYQGNIYHFSDEQIQHTQYRQHGVRLPEAKIKHGRTKMAAMSMQQLLDSKQLRDKSELHWRFALPVSALMLALLAVPLSHTAPRKGRYGKLVIAILFYAVYVNVLIYARKMIEKGVVPLEWGMWWVHILSFSLLAFIIYRRQKT